MRLFVAVDPPEVIQQSISLEISRLRNIAPNAKWARLDALHLTLVFIGEVAEEKVPAFVEALAPLGRAHGPMALEAAGTGSFGPPLHPRVLWIGVGGQIEALGALRADVVGALQPLGFQAESRPFSPHLTLARSRAPRGDPALALCAERSAASSFGRFDVVELILYRSETAPSGARYTAVARIPLLGQ